MKYSGTRGFTHWWHERLIQQLDWRIFRSIESVQHGCWLAARWWGKD